MLIDWSRVPDYNEQTMNTSNEDNKNLIIIQGVTKDGRKFRPSDWAERMSGMLSSFGEDHRIHYSPQLKPVNVNGIKCIAIDPELEQSQSGVFNQIIDFARRNDLNIVNEKGEPI